MSMRGEGGMGSQYSNDREAWVTQDNNTTRPKASRPGPISTSFLRSRAHDHGASSGLLRLGLEGGAWDVGRPGARRAPHGRAGLGGFGGLEL